ncbi:MAG: hypothetical protein C0412_07635 [Flavobacterium sp.]|nr:hypothetical protein [Flavobacterium sp.]
MFVNKGVLLIVFFFSFELFAQAKILGTSPNEIPANSLLGWSVSIHGEFAAVSAPKENYQNLNSAGALYIYKLIKGEWKYFQRIIPSDPSMMKQFGISLKLYGSTLLVGAPNDNSNIGAAYVFKYNGSSWQEAQKIVPQNPILFQGFGSNVDVAANIAIISSVKTEGNDSASGSVYIYDTNSKNWIEEGVIKSPAANENDIFGSSIVIASQDNILITAPRGNGAVKNCGLVYSFIKSGKDWELNQSLSSPNFRSEGLFGCSISYSEGRIIVGAMHDFVDSTNSGAAYLYKLNNIGKWNFEKRFTPDNKRKHDYFGMSVFINKDIAIVGSPKWDKDKLKRNSDMGCADVFTLSDSGWSSVGKIVPEDGKNDDHFGMAISSFENSIIIGSRLDDNSDVNTGSAYFYKLNNLFPSLSPKFIPDDFQLYNNYPNPFNSLTTIKYDLPYSTKVEIIVYDILGRKIIELVNSEIEAGRKQVTWNGTNSNGYSVSSGIYIFRLITQQFSNSKKMILLK